MSTSENVISDNNNNHVKPQPAPPRPPRFQRYEFPLLAEDPVSLSLARSDPLACNINNDAVLIWKDVTIHPNNRPPEVSHSPTTIEDVFRDLQSTAQEHIGARDLYDQGSSMALVDPNNKTSHSQNPVVARRRLFEQGVDSVFESPLNSYHPFGSDSRTLKPSKNVIECQIVGKGRLNDTSQSVKRCNDDMCVSCVNDVMLGQSNVELAGERKDEICWDVERDTGSQSMKEVTCFSKGKSFPLPTNGNDITVNMVTAWDSVDRANLDSGHFEDMSFDLSPGAYENSRNDDIDGDVDEQYVSQTDISGEMFQRRKSEGEDYSEVFVEDEKELAKQNNYSLSPDRSDRKLHALHKHRRHSGILKKSRRRSSGRDEPWRDDGSVWVRCENYSCRNVASLADARKTYKNCHHCLRTYYCCRECRREDWDRHKYGGACHGSLVSSACKKVITYCNTNPEVKAVLSRLALRGYLSHGRGCVMLGFPDLESTEEFLEYGFPMLELNPIYVGANELSGSKMYGNVLETLLETCKFYQPDVKFVLNVGVGLRFKKEEFLSFSCHRRHPKNHQHYHLDRSQSCEDVDRSGSVGSDLGYGSLSNSMNVSGDTFTSPTRGGGVHRSSSSSRHKAPILQKCIKLRLSPTHPHCQHEKRWTFEDHFWDQYRTSGPTLILTGIPDNMSGRDESKKRELTFANIQRKLRLRNVNLRRQYPSVYAQLIDYVTKGVHFPSQILFPADTKTGRTFTCFMMPEAEAELEWMQSHHLLNDLELSKDSMNKSMSRSLSSSMRSGLDKCISKSKPLSASLPTLLLRSPHSEQSTSSGLCSEPLTKQLRSVPSTHLKAEADGNPIERTPRSLSHSELNSFQRTHNEHATDASSEYQGDKSRDLSGPILPIHKHRKHVKDKVQGVKVPKDQLTSGTQPKFYSTQNLNNGLSPISIHVDQDCSIDQAFHKNGHAVEEADEILESADTITPQFYPVRKAKNVRLYSHAPCPTGDLGHAPKTPNSPSTLATLSVPSPAVVTASGLSPALFTSTPLTKSFQPPAFGDLFPNHASTTSTRSHGNNSKDHTTMYTEYGFDSCYRNKVIVDEVDRMKLRRNDRGTTKSKSAPLSPCDTDRPCWPADYACLDSPPLATSTLLRSVDHVHKNTPPRNPTNVDGGILGPQECPCNLNIHVSSSSKRKFNTNSPFFPNDAKLIIPNLSRHHRDMCIHKRGELTNNCPRDKDKSLHTCCHGIYGHKNSTSPPRTKTGRDISPNSSPVAVTNTQKLPHPNESSSTTSIPFDTGTGRKHQPHLRMRVVNDVTHLTPKDNPKPVSQTRFEIHHSHLSTLAPESISSPLTSATEKDSMLTNNLVRYSRGRTPGTKISYSSDW